MGAYSDLLGGKAKCLVDTGVHVTKRDRVPRGRDYVENFS